MPGLKCSASPCSEPPVWDTGTDPEILSPAMKDELSGSQYLSELASRAEAGDSAAAFELGKYDLLGSSVYSEAELFIHSVHRT